MAVHSGGSAKLSGGTNARATFAFRGTGANWIAYRDQWSGIAKVYIDNVLTGEIDTYASPAAAKSKAYGVTGLAEGAHTLTIEVTGRKSVNSAGISVWVDAFETTSTGGAPLTPAPTTSTATLVGGKTMRSAGVTSLRVGFATLDAAGASPSGLAVLALRQNGVVLSEASVTASEPVTRGRIFAESDGVVNTGFAIANPNDSPAIVNFFFTDANGKDLGAGSLTLAPHAQIARFLNEAPFNSPKPFTGSLTFNSNVPVAAIALRGLTNERSEFLVTTLPIANPDATNTSTSFFPHIADGSGWTTQFVLVNPSEQTITGSLQLFAQDSSPLTLNVGGTVQNTVPYTIAPRSSKKFTTLGTDTTIHVGSARVVPAGDSAAPVGTAIFGYKSRGVTVSEAGVPTMASGKGFRLYAEASESGDVRTGVAILNTSGSEKQVRVELVGPDGTSTGLSTSISMPAMGQRSLFVDEIPGFESLPKPFKVILRMSSEAGIAVIGLRSRVNERNDFLVTTLASVNEAAPAPSLRVFPHVVDGGGYTTEFILFSGSATQPVSGNLRTYSQSGAALNLDLK